MGAEETINDLVNEVCRTRGCSTQVTKAEKSLQAKEAL